MAGTPWEPWYKLLTEFSMERTRAKTAVCPLFSRSVQQGVSLLSTTSAPKRTAPTAGTPNPAWCKVQTETSTGPLSPEVSKTALLSDAARSLKSAAQASLRPFTSFAPSGRTPCPDGANPAGSRVQGADGNFYGMTNSTGDFVGGTVFKITPSGVLTTLYTFCSITNCADGSSPQGALIAGTDGNFYGTTSTGGFQGCNVFGVPNGCGTIFKITPSGALTTLYRFCHRKDCPDGSIPQAALIQATDGNFYGTTFSGGTPNCGFQFLECGTIYRLSVGLAPFVSLPQPFGRVGQIGPILGQGFTGATAVSLNGIPASFTVASDTYIRATVPAGATTGFVIVTTPSGTFTSNVAFQVRP
jgi:uncharacterized repeat protein (TIGR03803 family)